MIRDNVIGKQQYFVPVALWHMTDNNTDYDHSNKQGYNSFLEGSGKNQ